MSTDDGLAWIEASDGAIVGVDPDDGEVMQAFTPDGEPLDPDGYVLTYDEPEPEPEYEPDPYSELDERFDRLEQRLNEPRPIQFEQVVDELNGARVTEDLAQQRERLEAPEMFGRPLLLREQQVYGQRAADHVLAGDARPDLAGAAGELHDEGTFPLLDLDDEHRGRAHEARAAWMAERLADQQRYEAAGRGEDDLSQAEPPPTQTAFDISDRAERQQYMAERMRGADVVAYDGTDYEETFE